MKAIPYESLNDAMKAQFKAILKGEEKQPKSQPVKSEIIVKNPTRKMTNTEREYQAILHVRYGFEHVHFEALTLRLRNGHKYTPDFVVNIHNHLLLVEVKGAYRMHSHGRAKLAYDQAKLDWPMFDFEWVTKQKGGGWA